MTRPGPKPKPLTLNGLEIDLLGKLDRATDARGIFTPRTPERDRLQRLGLIESYKGAPRLTSPGVSRTQNKYWRLTVTGLHVINSRRLEDDRT